MARTVALVSDSDDDPEQSSGSRKSMVGERAGGLSTEFH